MSAADGFGERKGNGPQAVPRKEFRRDAKLAVGMPLELKDSSGTPVRVWVTKVVGGKVWIDLDHPLAGKELTFDVELLFVRDPTPRGAGARPRARPRRVHDALSRCGASLVIVSSADQEAP